MGTAAPAGIAAVSRQGALTMERPERDLTRVEHGAPEQTTHGDQRMHRTFPAAVLVLALGLALAPSTGAAAGIAPLRDGGRGALGAPGVARSAGAPVPVALVAPAAAVECRDRTFTTTGGRWADRMRWSYLARSTPDGVTREGTVAALRRAVRNITGARNDCGRPDRVEATAGYLGTTRSKPGVTREGGCVRDGQNVVGFGRLPEGVAGLTCVWVIGDERIVEADIKLDRAARWTTSLSGCAFEMLIEAVATHEFGHAFGLGHVSEARHGRLTMSERLDGLCQNQESTLGLGDLLGLEELY
jgi:hypothetical protein